MRIPNVFIGRGAVVAALCWAATAAHALDPHIPLAQLRHDMWTSKDGMPGDVWDMAQGADGAMWFGTTSGLYRFDGVRFERVAALGGAALQSNVVAALRAFPDGSLWIGYRFGGIDAWDGAALRRYGRAQGLPAAGIRAIERDRHGRTWAASVRGLLRLAHGRWIAAGAAEGLPGPMSALLRGPDGALLASDGRAAYRLDEATLRFAPAPLPAASFGAQTWPDGRPLDEDGDGRRGSAGAAGPDRAGLPRARTRLLDRDGNLWSAGAGLLRAVPADRDGLRFAAPEILRAPERISSPAVMTLLEDREGNIWAGTRRGVDRYRNNRLVSLGLPPGFSHVTLAPDADGAMWVTAMDNGAWRTWKHTPDGLRRQDERRVTSLAAGADGSLLLGGDGYIERRGRTARLRIPFPVAVPAPATAGAGAGVRLLLDDGAALWASFAMDRLYRHADGRWRPATDFGLPERAPVSMARDGHGTLWFGYGDDEIVALREGRARRYGPAEGLDIGAAGAIQDVGGALLAAGDRGLALLAGARFVRVGAEDAQALAGITGILQTPDGDLWLNGGKGLVHVRAADWRAWLAQPAGPLAFELFDTLDGYPGIAHFRAAQPSLALDRAGRIWVGATDGAAWIDPARLHRNRMAPPVGVRALSAGGRAFGARDGLALPPGTRALQLDYGAASFTMPERVRFRYRLDGVDGEWQEAGARRTAYYNNLGPGSYRFLVTAANEDGVWNPQPAALTFRILPSFWQRPSFLLLCAAALALGAWLLYRLRLRRATARLRRLLRERANERERIARTLHDTLMQSVQALLMLFEHARDGLPPDSPSRPLLERTLAQARGALAEGRDELSALRGASLAARDLAAAVAPLGRILGEQFGVRFESTVAGAPRALCRDVALEACFIAREALQNAFRHAHAGLVGLEVHYGEQEFALRVRDDGHGMATDASRPGHWGLAGMRERAAAIGARLEIGPNPGGGTLVELRLEAACAYERRVGPRQTRTPFGGLRRLLGQR